MTPYHLKKIPFLRIFIEEIYENRFTVKFFLRLDPTYYPELDI